jgi:hypothetical protein
MTVTRRVVPALALAAVVGALATAARSEEPPVDPAEMMKQWQKWAAPGERHRALEWFVGKWTVEMRVLSPGSPEQKSAGEAEFSWLMPGRWLSQRLTGTLMGAPYQGFGISGYDNYKHKYVGCWVDGMGTAMLHYEGVVVDPTGTVQTHYGTLDEFLTGEHDKAVKYVTRKTGPDSFDFEIHDLGIGEAGAKVMHFAYRRKKAN